MMELYIDRGITQSRLILFNDGRIEELYIENHDDRNITGNVFKGRIENIVPALNAAFVNIGALKNAILHLDDMKDSTDLKKGQEIIVQVIREASGDKGARVSGNISIPGKYIVLLPNQNYKGISKKINDSVERLRLEELANRIYMDKFGLIMRTEAYLAKEEEIEDEYRLLLSMWHKQINIAKYLKPPVLLIDTKDFLSFAVREYVKSDIDRIYLNRPEDRDTIKDLLKGSILYNRCQLIYDEYDFSKIARIEKEIENLLQQKRYLSSGGSIVIDKTEALTAIDVNTGSKVSCEQVEESILNTNVEACRAVADAIRLNNISGIIIIDFIDMKENDNREKVIEELKECFKNDKVQNRIYGFTKLGLLEMARAKKGKRLSELIYCDNNSFAYNTAYILKLIENQCLRLSRHYNRKKFYINVEQQIMNDIKEMFPDFIDDMIRIYGLEVIFIPVKYIKNFEILNENRDRKSMVKIEIESKSVYGIAEDISEDEELFSIRVKKL